MKTFTLIFLLIICFTAPAQQVIQAFAQQDDTYLLFSDSGFDQQKKYVLFNFWNSNTPNADIHNTQFQTMKQIFSGNENIEFVNVQWNTNKDIQEALERFQIESNLEYGKHVRLSGDHFNLNTSSTNAFFLIEDSKAAFLCSGGVCSKKIKEFFDPHTSN